MITNFKIYEKTEDEYVVCIKYNRKYYWHFTVGKSYKLYNSDKIIILDDDDKICQLADMTMRLNPKDEPKYKIYNADLNNNILFTTETLKEYQVRKNTTKFDL